MRQSLFVSSYLTRTIFQQQSDFSDDGEHVQNLFSTPETIHYGLESGKKEEVGFLS